MSRARELRFDRDGFLAWMVGLMVFLATLAIAAALAADAAAGRWARDLAGSLTLQVPAAAADRVDALAEAIRRVPGVESVAPLGRAETAALLEPWLGPGARLEELPLPRLIDVRVADIDLAALRKIVAETAPGAVVDDHRSWTDRLASVALSIELAALLVVALVAAAASLTVVFATRAGLEAQRGAVELLHLVGARDRWIAHQVELQALRLAIKGGIGGFIAAFVVIGVIAWAVAGEELRLLLPRIGVPTTEILSLLAVPVAAGLVAMVTARIAVIRALRRLP